MSSYLTQQPGHPGTPVNSTARCSADMMTTLLRLATQLLLTSCWLTVSSSEQGCQELSLRQSEISLRSRRNETGHWISQLSFSRASSVREDGSQDVPTMQFNLQRGERLCGGQETVYWLTTLTAPPPPAGPGYELFPGLGRYKLHTTPKTWAEARTTCAKENAHLAIVNSEKESDVLRDMLAEHPANTLKTNHNDAAYLGFHDMHKEGQLFTIFGEPLESTGFTRWFRSDQPDNAKNNKNCGSLYRNGGLNDITCSYSLLFFCEQELW